MKTMFIAIAIIFGSNYSIAQQISINEMARTAKFSKTIDEINNGKAVLKYVDIQGNPFYRNGFSNAKIGETGTILPIRYNMFKDAIELLNNNDIYEIPKEKSLSQFIFTKTNEKFILDKDNEDVAGYFLVLADGKNKLLKKMLVKFSPEIPAPNTLLPGTPAKFENQKPIYFIKTEDKIIKLTKNTDDLINVLPLDKKDSVKDFIKTNKIKFKEELDLIKLVNFLNK